MRLHEGWLAWSPACIIHLNPKPSASHPAPPFSAPPRPSPPQVRLLQLPGLNAAPGLPPLGLLPGEAVTALRMVYLKDAASENVRPYLAIGTAMTLGEAPFFIALAAICCVHQKTV